MDETVTRHCTGFSKLLIKAGCQKIKEEEGGEKRKRHLKCRHLSLRFAAYSKHRQAGAGELIRCDGGE